MAEQAAGPTIPAGSDRPSIARRLTGHTAREFAFQLATITAGVLIALSVDGVVEWRRQRALVREAHAAMGAEIRENLADLEGTLSGLETHRSDLALALRFADDLLRTGKTDVHELRFGVNLASLNRASWQSAERTGALGYMSYPTVQAYAEIYQLQDLLMENQRQLLGQIGNLSAIVLAAPGGDPMRSRPADLEIFRSRVIDAAGAVTIHLDLSRQLIAVYKQVPAP